jgi:hypothetical protein
LEDLRQLTTPYMFSKSIIYILNNKNDGIGFDFRNGTENGVQYVIGVPIKVD